MIYIIVKIIFKLLEIYRKQVKMISNDFIDFVRQSPTAYNCVENVKNVLIANGFNELSETEEYHLEKGKKYFVTRNGSALIAFTLGSKVNENSSFQIVASHCDSPSFKLKPESIHAGNGYVSLNVEPYGGMIMSSFLDRPLSLGGRVIVEKDGNICSQAVYIDRPLCLIPSLCIHFNRDVNNGYKFNPQKDLQPLFSLGDKVDFKEFLKDELKIDGEILNYDLFLYNYGAVLHKMRFWQQSIIELNRCAQKLDDSYVQLILADNYKQLKQYDHAERCLLQASHMCPNRFLPLYYLVNLYQEIGRSDEAIALAQRIVEKPVKIPSYTINKIKADMKRLIHWHKQELQIE